MRNTAGKLENEKRNKVGALWFEVEVVGDPERRLATDRQTDGHSAGKTGRGVQAVPHWAGGGDRPLQIVARPPNLAVLLKDCDCNRFSEKNSKFDATRCLI